MLFLIVADATRNIEVFDGENWVKTHDDDRVVLGTMYADSYEDALEKGSNKYEIRSDYIDAYHIYD